MKLIIVFTCLVTSALAINPASWRIVGGQDATEGQFPYQVYVNIEPGHYCGGSILDPNTILCAAHCVYGRNGKGMTVTLGSVNVSEHTDKYPVAETIVHKNYNPTTMLNDISIIKLQSSIRLRPGVAPVDLPTSNIGVETVTLSGWGLLSYPGSVAHHLQFIILETITIDDCQKVFGTTVGDTHICTFTKAGEGSCTGDSGGPLVNQQGEQIGIVSFGIPCGKGFPDVFTRVYSYLDWIEANRY